MTLPYWLLLLCIIMPISLVLLISMFFLFVVWSMDNDEGEDK